MSVSNSYYCPDHINRWHESLEVAVEKKVRLVLCGPLTKEVVCRF
jgi:hypothetical protein